MALTNNNLAIMKALANNDIHSARVAALASLAEDTSKKNSSVINYYKKLLIGNASTMLSNMPSDMQTFLVGESPDGFDEARYYLRDSEKEVVDDVIKMKLIADELSLRHIPYKNTTLLYGFSGTGKTELGRYIAYRMHLPFFYISFVSTIESYMGSTAKNLHKVFEFCNTIPCVLMLDEIDCVAAKRNSGGSKGADGELERTTIALMQELDKLPNHVVVLAGTNRLDLMDDALTRRFSVKHEVKNMTKNELYSLAKKYLHATNTIQFVSEKTLQVLVQTAVNPGQLMPELIKEIGRGIYEKKKDILPAPDEDALTLNVWEVVYTWTTTIAADTEEDAISIGRRLRTACRNNQAREEYKAKRAEFIGQGQQNS